MPFIPAEDTVQVFWEHAGPDDVILGNVTNFRALGVPVTTTTMEALAAELVAWYDVEMQPLKTAGYSLTRLRMRNIGMENGQVVDYTTTLPITGTAVGNSLPSNVALSLKLNTGFGGRSYRGRLYHFGFSEDQVSGNFVDTAVADDILASYNQLITSLATPGNWEWVVVSYVEAGAPRTVALVNTILNVSLVDRRIDTQRRRLPE
jgi:hypothetical protein